MKKLLIYSLLIFFCITSGTKLYWYIKEENNLFFIISNQINSITDEDQPSFSIKVLIDDSLHYHNNSLLNSYNMVESKASIGKHKLTVCIDSFWIEEKYIYVIPMKWIIIEYPNRECNNNIYITTHDSSPKLE